LPFLDGVYADNKHGTSGFHRLKAPTNDELIQLTHTIAHRVGRYLERRAAMTWAQRLKRVFNIDIETCGECGGEVRIIATIA
jgi:hypothetical protein